MVIVLMDTAKVFNLINISLTVLLTDVIVYHLQINTRGRKELGLNQGIGSQ